MGTLVIHRLKYVGCVNKIKSEHGDAQVLTQLKLLVELRKKLGVVVRGEDARDAIKVSNHSCDA